MRLIILAAGYGGRLSPATESTPKALLDIRPGTTIMDHQLATARACGFESVSVVTGFQSEMIEAKLDEYKSDFESLDWHYNPFFRVTNNLVSLWFGLPSMDEDFVFLNGDDIFHEKVMSQLLRTTEEFVAVTSTKSTYDGDDTKIQLDNEKITKIGKDLDPAKADGEWIGMCKISGRSRLEFIDEMNRLVRDSSLRDGPWGYLPLLQSCIDTGIDLNYVKIDSTEWAEVDFQMDLDFVRANLTRFTE
jgi:L-glutamine-phosphate cytidylyltransferase